MSQDCWYDPARRKAMKAGRIWVRRDEKHESRIKILRHVNARIGERYLVQGLDSGRQWMVLPSTLLHAYDPQ